MWSNSSKISVGNSHHNSVINKSIKHILYKFPWQWPLPSILACIKIGLKIAIHHYERLLCIAGTLRSWINVNLLESILIIIPSIKMYDVVPTYPNPMAWTTISLIDIAGIHNWFCFKTHNSLEDIYSLPSMGNLRWCLIHDYVFQIQNSAGDSSL